MSQAIAYAVRHVIAETLRIEASQIDRANTLEADLDADFLELAEALVSKLGVDPACDADGLTGWMREVEDCVTVGDLIDLVESRLGGAHG